MRSQTLILCAAIAVLLSTAPLFAALIQVPTEDYQTIQAGIDAAEDGDTVLVAPGEYVENINFDGKNIIVSSYFAISGNPDHIAATIIDGDENGTVVTFANGEDAQAAIVGFTIVNGSGTTWEVDGQNQTHGGGILAQNNSSPIISSCVITGNSVSFWGGGVLCHDGSNPIINECTIFNNHSANYGGGIFIAASSPTLAKCVIYANTATQGAGVGVYREGEQADSSPIIGNCTIALNSIDEGQREGEEGERAGGGMWMMNSSPVVVSTIIYFNTPDGIHQIDSDPVIFYNDIQDGGDGQTNIDEDPLFADPDNGDFHLTADSPCIDSGDPDSPEDPDGTRADMGAFYFHQQGEEEPPNITYYLYFGTWIPGQGQGPTLRITPLGENVRAGEVFTIPNYELANYNLGESFQVYMDAIAGTTVEIEEGAIDEDIELHLVLNNMLVSGGQDGEPFEFNGIWAPDQNVQNLIWMFADYQIWTADADSVQVNAEEDFEFIDDNNMVVSVPLDNEFLAMMEAMGLDYDLLGAAFWLPFQEQWEEAGIVSAHIEIGEESWFRVTLSHLSQVISGPEGVYGDPRYTLLEEGWNLISCNYIPEDYLWTNDDGPDMEKMFRQLNFGNDHNPILQVKDENGRFYWPEGNFNRIPHWEIVEGYRIKIEAEENLVWFGDWLPRDTDIPLEEGWNNIAFFGQDELPADGPEPYVLGPIIDDVILAKDVHGRFMLPRVGFSNMPPWRPTQGYQVNVGQDVVLNYPEGPEEGDFARGSRIEIPDADRHWLMRDLTDANMSVLVSSIDGVKPNDHTEIAAFNTAGELVGAGVVGTEGRCGLAVWGDDPTTETVEGLRAGEAFELRLWISGVEADLSVASNLEGELIYNADGLSVVDVSADVALPTEYFMSAGYPNPFNSSTRIDFGLPETAKVKIQVYDLSGRMVTTLINGRYEAGHHFVSWDAKGLSSGLYFIEMRGRAFNQVRKIVLTK